MRRIGMLSQTRINSLKDRGFYCDGGGLYLQVSPSGSKSWVFRSKQDGRTRDMGLGALHTIGLKEARELATEQRKLRLQGIDPIEHRNSRRQAVKIEAAKQITFEECASRYMAMHSDGWKNAKHRAQWENTLRDYAYPVFGKMSVQEVDTTLVLAAIEPQWKRVPETATRLRARIETVLDWAKAHGYRQGENPARWAGHLKNILPARSKVAKVEHHPALPYADIAGFMVELQGEGGTGARALEFTILNAARTQETTGAKWSEIDTAAKVWVIPGERMKMKVEHRVPLSARALAILQELKKTRNGDFIFAGRNGREPSNMSMAMLLRRMGQTEITVHGFRSTFRDWGFEVSSFPHDVIEAALAHKGGDKVVTAYKRGDALEKRRKLMEAWAAYCAKSAKGDVVSIGTRR